MANFKIERFRYNWRGAWSADIGYNRDDVVVANGTSYVCIKQHTSSTLFGDDFLNVDELNNVADPKWVKMTDGVSWQGLWESDVQYQIGDIVANGGNLWFCVLPYLSQGNFDDNIENWTLYATSIRFTQEWEESTRYGINDLVRYNGKVYRCIEGHDSQDLINGLEQDFEKWTLFFNGVEFVGGYELGVRYRKNDLVIYNGSLLRCIEGHVSEEIIIDPEDSSIEEGEEGEGIVEVDEGPLSLDVNILNIDPSKWQIELFGEEFNGDWAEETFYGVGSVVRHGGYLYYSISNNYNRRPTLSFDDLYLDSSVDWIFLSKAIRFKGIWNEQTPYFTGDVVRAGGNLYLALLDTELFDVDQIGVTPEEEEEDPIGFEPKPVGGTPEDFIDSGKWELLTTSQQWVKSWIIGNFYFIGQIVYYRGSAWQATVNHLADNLSYPGSPGNGNPRWIVVLEATSDVGMSIQGDLLTYGNYLNFAGDFFTEGAMPVPIGKKEQALTVKGQRTLGYSDNWGVTERRFFVAPEGEDDDSDPERGFVFYKPWKTIRYACEKADDGFAGNTTVEVATGKYKEILPIIVPVNTVVNGAELRSTAIVPNEPIPELAEDSEYTIAVLERISLLLPTLLDGVLDLAFAKTPGNPLEPVVVSEFLEPEEGIEEIILQEDETGTPLETNPQVAIDIQALIVDIINYIQFYLENGDTLPAVQGTNIPIENQLSLNAIEYLLANREFLAEEAVAYMKLFFPDYNFDPELCKRDVRRYIDAWAYDIEYPGNYKSLLAARYYRNAVLGSKNEDMFYMRDATGARNFTCRGLEGVLPIPTPENPYAISFDAPAFFSFDPGWGPDDDRTWIKNRSPYMQNITNFGTAAIGQKLDGFLHNGGNRSFVSNDFTQVIDDGIGAWVYNVARAELVSVFTYYCNIGYLTTSGGIIRSTNGNNSYGNWGAVAIGVNPEEDVDTANVDNRKQQAIVASVFTGEFQDELQIFEWANAGQNYTEANANIIGAGVGALVEFDDFRDGAVFESRLLDTSEDPEGLIQEIGGGGYTIARSTAQASGFVGEALDRIRIAVNDPNIEADYQGMRIIIVSGVGTGQYAEIVSYNESNKIVVVKKESTGEAGWDHLVPGTPLVTLFDNSTTYSIEPKVTFSSPEFENRIELLGSIANWSAGAFGGVSESYLFENIAPVDIENTEASEPATFEISYQADINEYLVDILVGGLEFVVGEEFFIEGTQLGGVSPTHDLTLVVSAVDSEGKIQSVDIIGNPPNKKYIVLSDNSPVVIRSADGINWEQRVNPSPGEWKAMTYGDEKFVAIQNNSNLLLWTENGINWNPVILSVTAEWNAIVYGNGKFVAVSSVDDSSLAYVATSENGTDWTVSQMPNDGDWIDVAYGKGKFVALSNMFNIVAVSLDGVNWEIFELLDDLGRPISDDSSTDLPWVSITYGNNRFVAISALGDARFSFNGEDWTSIEMPDFGDSTLFLWKKIKYYQGVFLAINRVDDDVSEFIAVSRDGIDWEFEVLTQARDWNLILFGNPLINEDDSVGEVTLPRWLLLDSGAEEVSVIKIGVSALGRVIVASGRIGGVRLWDPGSGYVFSPEVDFFSPNATSDAAVENRIAAGALSNPSWINRGSGYRIATTSTTITGNGFADIVPVGRFVGLTNLPLIPIPGSQILFEGRDTIYTVILVRNQNNNGGTFDAEIRISPELRVSDNITHNTPVILRRLFSQNRITGHDFLDVGTGNFEKTNYPELYKTGIIDGAPENEVDERLGGKVFYTATNEIGNFRAGELFEVEQATGIVTLSADFFDLAGLSELRLGGIRVGGSGVVIREFSTDPLLTADSNNVVSTQRAIARFLQNRLTVGGSDVEIPGFVAGQVSVAGAEISNAANLKIVLPSLLDFSGDKSGIRGSIMAQTMFHAAITDQPDFDL